MLRRTCWSGEVRGRFTSPCARISTDVNFTRRGVVFLREVKDKDKALELWRRAESADPDFARTVRLRQTIERVEKP